MDAFFRSLASLALIALTSSAIQAQSVWDAAPAAGLRFNIQMRDGSQTAGTLRDKYLSVRSASFGEMTLPVERIRSLEFPQEAGPAKLVTTSNETFQVQLITSDLLVDSASGSARVATAAIKSLRAYHFHPNNVPQQGLIGFWSGDGDAEDSVAGNNGTAENVNYVNGVAGQAFSFDPDSFGWVGVKIPDQPAYELTHSLTIEGWIRPRSAGFGEGQIIFCRGDHRPGLDPYSLAFNPDHGFGVCFYDANGENASVGTQPVAIGAWVHVAAVLDDYSGMMSIYTNGVLAVQKETSLRPFGPLLSDESPGVGIGNLNDGGNNFPFRGDIAGIGLYNRALSPGEIYSIYQQNAANAGERAEPFPRRIVNDSVPAKGGSWGNLLPRLH